MKADFLVIGSGIAGLTFALRACKYGEVVIITKSSACESNTYFAQGGIAAPLSENDSPGKHIEDTKKTGDGLCKEDVVKIVVEGATQAISELMEWGVKFTRKGGKLALGMEGGHSERRIVHKEDHTGIAIELTLLERAFKERNIHILENHMAIDLITKHKFVRGGGENECYGAYVLDKSTGNVETFLSKFTILSTGGVGKVYLITSNPDIATGDGVAMAWRAGAKIANLEFIQFHPTVLYHPKAKNFLITEAVRGEGGVLRLRSGRAFMNKYHPEKELAPRDVVSRAIDTELKRTGDDCVFLDVTHLGKDFLIRRFPTVYEKCFELGIDISCEPIPVAPAAHFICGGVLTDIWGETSIKRLFTIGETACTGLHGANRLASNSLLESVVFSKRVLAKCIEYPTVGIPEEDVPPWKAGKAIPQEERILISYTWDEIRRLMWNYAGVVRSTERLQRALERIEVIKRDVMEDYWRFFVTADLIELRNICVVAELIIKSALSRKESRGVHYNVDYPFRNDIDFKKDTILDPCQQ